MIAIIAVSAAIATGLLVLLLGQLIPARSATVTRRVSEVAAMNSPSAALARKRRSEQREQIQELLERVGTRLRGQGMAAEVTRGFLLHAGYRHPNAVAIYAGMRLALAAVFAAGAVVLFPFLGMGPLAIIFAAVYMGAMGYMFPLIIVRSRVRRRQKEITMALPDTLDLLVVCVEAGLGLNQAFVRVADEIQQLSGLTAEEFHLLNLEIRAGTPRDEALRNLFERTGVDDIRGLTMMLIQADRFGTSIANALRVQSETLRDKRKQRAEEAAAKTTIKIIFPLVICILPALFVVLIGPGMLQIVEAFRGLGS